MLMFTVRGRVYLPNHLPFPFVFICFHPFVAAIDSGSQTWWFARPQMAHVSGSRWKLGLECCLDIAWMLLASWDMKCYKCTSQNCVFLVKTPKIRWEKSTFLCDPQSFVIPARIAQVAGDNPWWWMEHHGCRAFHPRVEFSFWKSGKDLKIWCSENCCIFLDFIVYLSNLYLFILVPSISMSFCCFISVLRVLFEQHETLGNRHRT